MDASTLKGRAVVSLTEGTKLGVIAQPLFDLQLLHLRAVEMTGENGEYFIPFAQLQSVGPDAITVASHKVAHENLRETLIELDQILHLKVVDQGGRFVGTVAHIDVDPTSGRVLHVAAHKGGVLGLGGTHTPIDPTTILSVGPELMTLAVEEAVSAV